MIDALIKRTTLIIRDMNASSQWYEEVLGMTLYYDDETATKAEDHFNTVVVGKGIPDDMPEYSLKV